MLFVYLQCSDNTLTCDLCGFVKHVNYGVIYMRPGRNQTGMNSYWPPYIYFLIQLHGTGLIMPLRPV